MARSLPLKTTLVSEASIWRGFAVVIAAFITVPAAAATED